MNANPETPMKVRFLPIILQDQGDTVGYPGIIRIIIRRPFINKDLNS